MYLSTNICSVSYDLVNIVHDGLLFVSLMTWIQSSGSTLSFTAKDVRRQESPTSTISSSNQKSSAFRIFKTPSTSVLIVLDNV
jgi:hypothetical protein